jgi:transposase
VGRADATDDGGGAVLSFAGSVRVFVALEPCDMRKGFEGLAGLVGTVMKEQLQSGALFVFGNRRRTRLKMLYFDGTGLWLLSKRLEEGTFSWPRDTEGKKTLRLRPEALAMLTDGVDLRGAKLRPWYEREEKTRRG